MSENNATRALFEGLGYAAVRETATSASLRLESATLKVLEGLPAAVQKDGVTASMSVVREHGLDWAESEERFRAVLWAAGQKPVSMAGFASLLTTAVNAAKVGVPTVGTQAEVAAAAKDTRAAKKAASTSLEDDLGSMLAKIAAFETAIQPLRNKVAEQERTLDKMRQHVEALQAKSAA